jgi:hypothetical protein
MPFTNAELNYLGKVSIDAYVKNRPVDQTGIEHPFTKRLNQERKTFTGGKQYVVENLRKGYDSNFQFYFGSDAVTYRKKETAELVQFSWGSVHDGFLLDEDTLLANGIVINDSAPKSATSSEKVQLRDLLLENLETLDLGFQEQHDYHNHQDGTQSTKAVAGLDHLVQLDPTSGTVGGIDSAANTYWQNNYESGDIDNAVLIDTMEAAWRKCIRNGGAPNFILVGQTYLTAFRAQAAAQISRYTIVQVSGQPAQMDPAIRANGVMTGLHFNGVPLIWDPVFQDLDANLSPQVPWEERCYFLNMRHIKHRPAQGHDMTPRRPPRQHDRYVHYWGLTSKYAITCNRRNAHWVGSCDNVAAE